MPDNAPVCRRCGRCCELGGPGLLRDDAPLLSSGALKPEMLVCLRRGQWARQDGMGGGLAQLENEMLKLAGTGKAPHPWQCLAYAPGTGCTIYERRPVQCGVLFCEDTRPLEALLRDVPALDRRAAIALLPQPFVTVAQTKIEGLYALGDGSGALGGAVQAEEGGELARAVDDGDADGGGLGLEPIQHVHHGAERNGVVHGNVSLVSVPCTRSSPVPEGRAYRAVGRRP